MLQSRVTPTGRMPHNKDTSRCAELEKAEFSFPFEVKCNRVIVVVRVEDRLKVRLRRRDEQNRKDLVGEELNIVALIE
jgi:hypothetical protein